MELQDDQAGQNASCPNCGNVSVVPAPAQPAGQAPVAPQPPSEADRDKDARTWGMLCHLAAFAGVLGIPFANIIGPLVIWLIQKDKHPFVDEQGKESVNFQISMTIYSVIAAILCFVLIGFVLLPALIVLNVVFVIIAAVAASKGQSYRYPLKIRFIR